MSPPLSESEIEGLSPPAILSILLARYPGRVAILSSFGTEAAILLHMAALVDRSLPVLFLDTERHFPETIAHRDALARRLALTGLRDIHPDPSEVAAEDPLGALWSSAPDACCALRKVRPLERALAGFDVVVDGRKRYHGAERTALSPVREEGGRLRVSPLMSWDAEELEHYRLRHDLPAHPLAAQGYASVGCQPCTSPVATGEAPRAGRWRGTGKTECGIHFTPPSSLKANSHTMDDLDQLEADSLFILREAYSRVRPLALLWSLGKDSNVLIWLARKAFLGRVPFPVMHLDTGLEFPEAYAFRERYAVEWGLELISDPCPPLEATDPTLPPASRVAARKTEGLRAAVQRYGLNGVIAGIRRDEQATRAKERIVSPRAEDGNWEFRDQPPEFWDLYNLDKPPGSHVRIHPLLRWTELDVWRYIARENIPVCDLYFAREGRRFRSLGEIGITQPISSLAADIPAILAELRATTEPERAGRSMDNETEDAFERLRVGGYL